MSYTITTLNHGLQMGKDSFREALRFPFKPDLKISNKR